MQTFYYFCFSIHQKPKQYAMRIFCILFCLISFGLPALHAQTNGYYLGVGGNYLKLKELNSALKNAGIGEAGVPKTNLTLGVFHQADRLFYGGEFSVITQVIVNSVAIGQTRQAYARFYQLIPRFGFAPLTFDDVYFFHPTIGIGGGVGAIRRVDNSVSPAQIRTSRVFGGALEGAMNITIITPIPGDKGSNVVLGLGVGYLYTPTLGKSWASDKIITGQNIAARPQGIFFRLSMGMANEQ